MARSLLKTKGRRAAKPFSQIYHALLDDPIYMELSYPAKALLIDATRFYNGRNNGDICLTRKLMRPRGWNSNDVLCRAKNELIEAGLLILTRQGGRHQCSLYGFSWLAIDECKGKLDINPTRTPPRPLTIAKKLKTVNRKAALLGD